MNSTNSSEELEALFNGKRPYTRRKLVVHPEWHEEARRLRDAGWLGAEIAKKFGVSRERVRQVLGNSGRNNRNLGKIIDGFEVLSKGQSIYMCRCIKCGHVAGKKPSGINSGHITKCRKCAEVDRSNKITGTRFGLDNRILVVKAKLGYRNTTHRVMMCLVKCDCGKRKPFWIRASNMERMKGCGCVRSGDHATYSKRDNKRSKS